MDTLIRLKKGIVMNFWHIQLHRQNVDEFSIAQLKQILTEKKVIGVGIGNTSKQKFEKECAIGDVVLVKKGATPVALVKITGNAETLSSEQIDAKLDWFEVRRTIDILEFYDSYNQPYEISSRGTLTPCRNLSNATAKFIVGWYKHYVTSHLIENIILEEEQIKRLKSLFKDYKCKWSEDDQLDCLEQWQKYKDKIDANQLELDDYTNTTAKSHDEDTRPGSYLCNFLERRTKAFGYSRPGSSHQYMVHANADAPDKYYVKNIGSAAKETATQNEALTAYNSWIKPLIKKLVSATTLEALSEIESTPEYKNYEAKQVLQKMVVLTNAQKQDLKLIHIYKSESIDFLANFFFDCFNNKQSGFFEKNNAIAIAAEYILYNGSPTLTYEEKNKLSSFLWELANAADLATEDSPNVIFYGAPGTGKTYTITNRIKFITNNDLSRIKDIQFHPSFTYEDFIDGLKPVGVTKDGNMKFEFVNGIFKSFCIDAKEALEKAYSEGRDAPVYYFIVDEINRANLSAVFGETLSLIESGYRDLKNKESRYYKEIQNCQILNSLINNSSGQEQEKLKKLAYYYTEDEKGVVKTFFGVPSNIRFIGMMNDVDKSIDSFDLALRRRFRWEQKTCDYDVVDDFYSNNGSNEEKDVNDFIKDCERLNDYIVKSDGLGLGSSYEFGHAFFMKMDQQKISKKNRRKLFENHLKPTLREYLRGFFEENEIDAKLKEASRKFGVNDDKNEEAEDED